jgi:hypothetical protein
MVSGMPVTSFLFSGAGGIVAAMVMGAAWHLFGRKGWMGLAGAGMLGAAAHNLSQLGVAYFLFVRNTVFLWQAPVMLGFSAVAGSMVGCLAFPIITAFQQVRLPEKALNLAKTDFTWQQKAGLPLLLLFVCCVFLAERMALLGGLAAGLFALAWAVRLKPWKLASAMLRFWGLFVWSLAVNALFSPGQYLVWRITYEGLEQAGQLSIRLALCIGASVLFARKSGMEYALCLASRIAGGRETLQVASRALALLPELAAKVREMRWRSITGFSRFVAEALQSS